jgi:hypothetical protein
MERTFQISPVLNHQRCDRVLGVLLEVEELGRWSIHADFKAVLHVLSLC